MLARRNWPEIVSKFWSNLLYRDLGFQVAWGRVGGERMFERRDTKRLEVNAPVTLSVGEVKVRTRMVNFSDQGALFRVDTADEDKVNTGDLGKEASLVVRIKEGPRRLYTGEIIRFFFKTDDKYIALRFWDPYRELPA